MTSKELQVAQRIAEQAPEGWEVFAVGGFVRDWALAQTGKQPFNCKDLDLEVFGPESVGELARWLSEFGTVKLVGQSFGVLKLKVDGVDLDVSLPRRESKTGVGHKDFDIEIENDPVAAAARRDFTINALAMALPSGDIIDYFDGLGDIDWGILRHTSPAFSEDPLRVLRAFQFSARFAMLVDGETVNMCQALAPEFHSLSRERVWGEWHKWAEKCIAPSMALNFLVECGWIGFFPELSELMGVEQDEEHHPEGDVWQHTLFTVSTMATICRDNNVTGDDKVVAMFAALLHDVGKVETTKFSARDGCDIIWLESDGSISSEQGDESFVIPTASQYNTWYDFLMKNGRIRSYGHGKAGGPIARQFLNRIGAPQHIIDRVIPLVEFHMSHVNFFTGGDVCAKHVRRLARNLGKATVEEWALVVEADHSGRPPKAGGLPSSAAKFVEIAAELALLDAQPQPVLMGRHLIEQGMQPGPKFGEILKAAFEAQLDGAFQDLDGALVWLAQ